MIQPKTRNELAAMATGIGYELGVAAGAYSETLLKAGTLSVLYSVDRWSDHHDDQEYQKAYKRLSQFGNRSKIIRSTFSDAVKNVNDESIDFIYIDGYAHTGQEGGQTLRDWWPKLKPGGIFSGHDYDLRWPLTIAAVDEFAKEHNLKVSTTDGDDEYQSWWVIKNG